MSWFGVKFVYTLYPRVLLYQTLGQSNENSNQCFLFKLDRFKDYDYSSYLKKYKQDEQDKFGSNQDQIIEDKLRKNNTKTSFFQAKEVFLRKYEDKDLTDVLNKNSTSINEMLISCKLGNKPCNPNDFEFFQLGEFNKCFKFNSGKNGTNEPIPLEKVDKFGKNNGFKLELYVGSQNECKSPLSTISGLVVYVHNSSYTLTEEDNALQVQPGTQADIMVDRTFIQKLPHPYSDCFKNVESLGKTPSDLLKRTIEYSKIYTQQYCLQLCYQDFLIEFCHCYDYQLPGFNTSEDIQPCPKFIDSLYNCQYLIKRLFYNGKNDAHCLQECPKECDYIQYDTTVSYIDFPSEDYLSLLKDHLPESKKYLDEARLEAKDISRESVLAVNVFYPSDSLTKITEEPKTTIIDTVMPNIGGHLGLFLGMSVLTFVEVIELIFEIINNRCLKRRSKKK